MLRQILQKSDPQGPVEGSPFSSSISQVCTAENNPSAGVDRKDGDGDQNSLSFLVHNILPTPQAQLEDGKRLLFHFIEEHLQINLIGLQSGMGVHPDQLIFVGPHGSSLCVPVSVLLEPRGISLAIVREKIRKSAEAFRKRSA